MINSLPRHRRDAPSQKRANDAAAETAQALDDRREDAWNTIFRPMIVRVQVRLDRIEIDLSAVRLVERLLQTCIPDSHPGEGDVMPRRADDESVPIEPIVRLSAPAQLKRTGKEMKFVVHGDRGARTADPSLVRLIVRAHMLMRRQSETPVPPKSATEILAGRYAHRDAKARSALLLQALQGLSAAQHLVGRAGPDRAFGVPRRQRAGGARFAGTAWWQTQSGETGLRDRAGLGNREKHTVDGCYCLFWGPKRRGLRFSERLNTRPDNVLADPEPNRPKQNKRKRNAKELPMTGDDSQRFWRFWSAYTLVFTMR